LQALTGLAGPELEYLKQKAIELGSTTTQSASQVAEAFTIIGSKTPELLKSKEALASVTKYAIVLSEAAGITVVEAANALTGSLNQMGAASSEAEDYINILAAASQAGAGDIPYLNKAIENLGGTASSVGVSFTQMVAAIEAIAPKFSDASSAGTYLRNIFLKLEASADKSLKPSVVGLDKAIENLSQKGWDATRMTKEFGLINVTAAMALVDSKDKYLEYAKAITGTNTAFEQQRINTDNVSGAIKGLSSAWEGLILNMQGSSGVLKGAISALTGVVNALSFAANPAQAYKSGLTKAFADKFKEDIEVEADILMSQGIAKEEALKAATEKVLLRIRRQRNNYDALAEEKREKGDTSEFSHYNMMDRGSEKANTASYYEAKSDIFTAIEGELNAGLKTVTLTPDVKVESNNTDTTGATDAVKKALEAEKQKQFGNDLTDEERTPKIIYPVLDELEAKRVEKWMQKQENESVIIDVKAVLDDSDLFGSDRENAFKNYIPRQKDFDGALQGFGAISDALSSISGLTDNSASKMLQWAASAASAIGQVISITGVLIAVKEAESNANAKAALTGVAASVAATPFLGPVLAISAVASLAAVLLALPKFATGGIVPGGSFTGDNVLARVNSGEMILNAAQQSNLFKMINAGATPRQGAPELVVRGDKLYAVLNNYTKGRSL
ncbi:MAG: phage tail tape measure protein, partial [Tannerellaceae bacterium]